MSKTRNPFVVLFTLTGTPRSKRLIKNTGRDTYTTTRLREDDTLCTYTRAWPPITRNFNAVSYERNTTMGLTPPLPPRLTR